MRTTISIDDDVLKLVREYAAARSVTMGEAVSELVRKAFSLSRPTKKINGLTVFDLPRDSPRVTFKSVIDLNAK